MNDYIIDFPTHQLRDWDIEVYCDDPAYNQCTTIEQSTASEITN